MRLALLIILVALALSSHGFAEDDCGPIIPFHKASDKELAFINKNFYEYYFDFLSSQEEADLFPLPPEFSVLTVDLNESGQKAYIIRIEHMAYCGSHGCSVDIWRKENGKFIKSGSTQYDGEGVRLCEKKDYGYRDLLIGQERHTFGLFRSKKYSCVNCDSFR